MLALNLIEVASLVFTCLAMAPAMAHLLELPNKVDLPPSQYLTVQQLYRGWALSGVWVVGALVTTVTLAVECLAHAQTGAFVLALVAALFVGGTQAVFWKFTFPVNKSTRNWTVLPADWASLRDQWEYSYATSAAFGLFAFVFTALSTVSLGP